MRRLSLVLSILAVGTLIVSLLLGPSIAERRMNRVRSAVTTISDRARQLHQRLFIVDLHADTLLWQRDLLKYNDRGHVDVPRLIKGNVAIQAFTAVNGVPRNLNMVRNENSDILPALMVLQSWPIRTWTSSKERALYQAKRFNQAVADSNGRLVWIRTASDLRNYAEQRRRDSMITAGFLGVEGGDALDGSIANLQQLFDAGFRMMSPTHFTDGDFGGSATGANRSGLSLEGRTLVREMESRRMIVDLAHASPQTIDDVLEIATRPILVSHTGVTATCDSNRNLSDDQIKRIADKRGLIGIAYFQAAICGTDASAIVRAIRHVVGLVGIEHIALGSDFDGGTTVPFDTSGLVTLTAALMEGGFSEDDIAKIMGENVLRFLESNLPQ